jgi:hypothetical protein
MISGRIELPTFCVLSRCHDQLDQETNSVGNKKRWMRYIRTLLSNMAINFMTFMVF